MKLLFVYILLCSDDSYYIGVTNNIERRLKEHQDSLNPESYTSTRLPVQLVYLEEFLNPNKAIAREKQLKGWTRVKKEALMKRNYENLKLLAKKVFCDTEYHNPSN